MARLPEAAALIAACVAAPAAAQLRPAPPAEVAAAADACIKATDQAGVHAETLTAAGWQRGTIQSKGKPADDPLRIYGHSSSRALLLLAKGNSAMDNVCMVTARIENFAAYVPTANAISAAIGTPPFNREGNAIRWRAGKLIVQLEPSGSNEAPAVRIGVTAVAEGK